MINKAIIVGNLGQEPEIKYTQVGTAVTTFSVATSEKWKDRGTGEQKRTHRMAQDSDVSAFS